MVDNTTRRGKRPSARNGKAPVHGRLREADDLFDAPPPHHREAEEAILASVFYDPKRIVDVAKIVSADDFHVPQYRRVFEAMLGIVETGALPDYTLVRATLLADGAMDFVGGDATLIEVAEAASTAANVGYFAKIVMARAVQRRAKSAGVAIIRHAYNDHLADGDLPDWHAGLAEIVSTIAPAKKGTRPAPMVESYRPFPVEALPEPVRGFVVAGAKAIGCDPSYIALPLLSELAAAIGNSRRICLKRTWYEPSIVWTAIVGESGTAKSPAVELATRPVYAIHRRAMSEFTVEAERYERLKLDYERDLAKWKSVKSHDDPPAKPAEPILTRYVTNDTTVEALAALLQNQPRGLLLVRDELAGWLGSFDRYAAKCKSGGDVAKWLELFHGHSLTVDRRSARPIYIPRASVSVAGGIQPDALRRSLSADLFANGLAARLLLACPPRIAKRWTEADVTREVEAATAHVIEALYELAPEVGDDGDARPVDLCLSASGKAAWLAYFAEHAAEQVDLAGDLAAAWSKLEGYAARLALIVHCVRQAAGDATLTAPDAVDEASIASGVALARWFGREAKRVYAMLGESEGEAHERRLVEWIRTRGGSATARQIQQGHRRYRDSADGAEAALCKLVEAGLGDWEPSGNEQGRPTRVFRLAVVYETPPKPEENGVS
jgi:hypothetical protein